MSSSAGPRPILSAVGFTAFARREWSDLFEATVDRRHNFLTRRSARCPETLVTHQLQRRGFKILDDVIKPCAQKLREIAAGHGLGIIHAKILRAGHRRSRIPTTQITVCLGLGAELSGKL